MLTDSELKTLNNSALLRYQVLGNQELCWALYMTRLVPTPYFVLNRAYEITINVVNVKSLYCEVFADISQIR